MSPRFLDEQLVVERQAIQGAQTTLTHLARHPDVPEPLRTECAQLAVRLTRVLRALTSTPPDGET
jgi:hypothetical protein